MVRQKLRLLPGRLIASRNWCGWAFFKIEYNAYGFLMCGLSCSSLSTRNKDNRMHETMNTNVNPHSRKPMLAGVLLFFVIGSCLVAPLELFLNCQWLIANCPVVIAAAELYCLFVLFLVCLSKLTNLKLL